MKTSSSSSTVTTPNFIQGRPLIKELNSVQLEALKFGLSSAFLGTTGGLLFGSGTSLMRGLQDSPAGRANVIKSFKLFSKLHKLVMLVLFSYLIQVLLELLTV